jgi:hypothetical protein
LKYPNSRNITCLITGAGGASPRTPLYGLWENNYSMGFYGKTTFCERNFHYYSVEVDPTAGTATFKCYKLGVGYYAPASFVIHAFK